MFWGAKLSEKTDYSCIVEHSFAITHAVAEVTTKHVEVHAKISNSDIILCHLNPAEGLLQERLDLRISEGEAISLYLKTHSKPLASTVVHLSGYLLDEPTDDQWENEFTDDEQEKEEETNEIYQPAESICDIRAYTFGNYPSAFDSNSSDEDYCYSSNEDDEEYRYIVNDSEDIRNQLPEIEELEDEDTIDKSNTGIQEDEKEEMTYEEYDEEQEEESEADEEYADSSREEEDKPSKSATRKRSREQVDDDRVTSGTIPGNKSKRAHVVNMDLDTTQPADSSFTSSSTSEPSRKKDSKNKVTITDVEVGTGKLARPGKKVYVQFKARLVNNNKLFDCSKKGKPFHFRLGQGEVIKGWDIGIKGMRVGGERHLLVPASKGYGAKGLPPSVPPHSDIQYTIKLLNVK